MKTDFTTPPVRKKPNESPVTIVRDANFGNITIITPEPAPDYPDSADDTGGRRVVLISADTIKPRPVFWLWTDRLALGTLGLLAGREGLGKSTLGYWLAARITRGELPGHYKGTPRGVLVCATEDSWAHTIVPRLMVAGADLSRVYRVDVLNASDILVGMALPRDLHQIEQVAQEIDAALLLLDPLMSRLPDLDTHRDAEVRMALEPLVAIADRINISILGLIHHNKSGSTDPLQLVMGSKAFTAVARSVHTVIPDPDDDTHTRRLFGTPKNNLGRTDLPTLTFAIVSHPILTDEGTAWTGRLNWGEELATSISDTMCRAAAFADDGGATSEAAEWLSDYLVFKGGRVSSADAKKAGKVAGHSEAAIKRAREKLNLKVTCAEFPRVTFWGLATPVGSQLSPRPHPTEPTEPTETLLRGEYPSTTTTTTTTTGAVGPVGADMGDLEPAGAVGEVCAFDEQLDRDGGDRDPTGDVEILEYDYPAQRVGFCECGKALSTMANYYRNTRCPDCETRWQGWSTDLIPSDGATLSRRA